MILLAVTESAFADWIDAADTVGGTAGICTSSVIIWQANVQTIQTAHCVVAVEGEASGAT